MGRDPTASTDPDAQKPFADLPRTPKPLRNDDYLGDQIVQWARKKRSFKFVFKRKIHLPAQNTPSQDDMYSRLVYLQAEDEVINLGRLGFQDETTVVELSAMSLSIALGDEFPSDAGSLASMDQPQLLEFLPPFWRTTGDASSWATKILPY